MRVAFVMESIVIVLNGASSSGKSSLARALQVLSPLPLLHASLDTFVDMVHWPVITGGDLRRECHTNGLDNFHKVLPILTASRFPVVVDHVFCVHRWYEDCRVALAGKKVYWVGVRCSLEILEVRENARGDRQIGFARAQYESVHVNKPYDLEIDTSVMSSEQCARAILEFITANETKG